MNKLAVILFAAVAIFGMVKGRNGVSSVALPQLVVTQPSADVRVIDGDTLEVNGVHYRVFGIAAPDKPADAKEHATRYAEQLVAEGVECRSTGSKSYDRIVAKCATPDGDFARFMVAAGYAFDWPRYSRGLYRDSQHEAQQAHAGLWALGYHPSQKNPNNLVK